MSTENLQILYSKHISNRPEPAISDALNTFKTRKKVSNFFDCLKIRIVSSVTMLKHNIIYKCCLVKYNKLCLNVWNCRLSTQYTVHSMFWASEILVHTYNYNVTMPDIDFWYLGGVHFAIQKIFKIFPILNKIQKGALKHKNRNLTLTHKLYVLICDEKKIS